MFLFFDLTGWERWQHRADGRKFTVSFELDSLPAGLPRIGRENFILHAVPVVNIFPHDADPVYIDHRASRYLVRPSGSDKEHHQIFSIDRVTGISRNTGRERSYTAFELFSSDYTEKPVYQVDQDKSQSRDGIDVHLSVAFPERVAFPDTETLSIELTCTNGTSLRACASGIFVFRCLISRIPSRSTTSPR